MKVSLKPGTGFHQNHPFELEERKPAGKKSLWRGLLRWMLFAIGGCIGLAVLAYLSIQTWPAIGAHGADILRRIIGDQAVASLEMKVNQFQDGIQKLKYDAGWDKPSAPWETVQVPTPALPATLPATGTETSIPEAINPVAPVSTQIPVSLELPQPSPTPPPSIWIPANLSPLGTAPGEGVWSPYIQDAEGHEVAFRTFLQPDPSRPYTLVAIVAIDLTRTRLHFVLGSDEPAGSPGPPRSGAIPAQDRSTKVLLAAFNGGFKARHGEFGAMADGITALPPRDGLGTIVLYNDGTVQLGAWGIDLTMTADVAAFRQNGPLVIQQGQIDARIYNNSPEDWGYSVIDVSPTVRTGIGLSKNTTTLFYFCGPSLSMEALAKSMQAAGAWNSIQLDINNYWALFVKFRPSVSNVIPEALLPDLMVANIERYLWDYTRDYFYVTGVAR